MHVARIGFTPLKGARHRSYDAVELAAHGPVGDRLFCLVDPARGRVLRTVENPTLVRAVATWQQGRLDVDLAGELVTGTPESTGEVLAVDYWGRTAKLEVQAGHWAEAFSRFLGYDVVLARATTPGEIVYGASVTLLTTATLRRVEEATGAHVDDARFRSTFLVATDGDAPGHVEDDWVGRTLRVGTAEVRVRGVVPRCAVVDNDPVTGRGDVPVLRTVAGYRRAHEVCVGVDAVVTVPGQVRTRDRVALQGGS